MIRGAQMSLSAIEARVYNTPLALSLHAGQAIAGVLARRRAGARLSQNEIAEAIAASGHLPQPRAFDDDAPGGAQPVQAKDRGPEYFLLDGGVAVIPVRGPLCKYAVDAQSSFGPECSYEDIAEMAMHAAKSGAVKSAILDIDSPGGEVAGCFEAAQQVRAAFKAAGKPLLTWCNSLTASAGYALAAAATHGVWTSASAEVGSIGVIAIRPDNTEAMAKAGFKDHFIVSGALKHAGQPSAAFTDEHREHLQSLIDAYAAQFVGLVSASRGVGAEHVLGLEAATFIGADAKAAGLVDRIGTFAECVAAARSAATTNPEPRQPGRRGAGAQGSDPMKNLINGVFGKRVSTQPDDEAKKIEDMPGDEPETDPEDEAAKKKAAEDMPGEDPEKDPEEDKPYDGAKGAASVKQLRACLPGAEHSGFVLEMAEQGKTLAESFTLFAARAGAEAAKAQAEVKAARQAALDATGGVSVDQLPKTTPSAGAALGITGDPFVDSMNDNLRATLAGKLKQPVAKVTATVFQKWAENEDRRDGAGAYAKFLTTTTTTGTAGKR